MSSIRSSRLPRSSDVVVDRGAAWPWRVLCPECLARARVEAAALVCDANMHRISIERDVLPLLPRERVTALEPFLSSYRRVRHAEGWGGDALYYLGLPFEDRSRRHEDIWKLRARTFRAALRSIERRFGREPLRVLELGAGNCWCAARLSARGHRVLATDVHLDGEDGLGALDVYRDRLEHVPDRARAEMTRLPLDAEQFDLVVANGAFHYAADMSQAAREAYRVLRAAGVLLVLDSPVYPSREDGEAMVKERALEHERLYRVVAASDTDSGFLVETEFARLLVDAGFEVEVERPFAGFNRALRRVWTRARGLRPPAGFPVWTAIKHESRS